MGGIRRGGIKRGVEGTGDCSTSGAEKKKNLLILFLAFFSISLHCKGDIDWTL
jgi:hypothetical protein